MQQNTVFNNLHYYSNRPFGGNSIVTLNNAVSKKKHLTNGMTGVLIEILYLNKNIKSYFIKIVTADCLCHFL